MQRLYMSYETHTSAQTFRIQSRNVSIGGNLSREIVEMVAVSNGNVSIVVRLSTIRSRSKNNS